MYTFFGTIIKILDNNELKKNKLKIYITYNIIIYYYNSNLNYPVNRSVST